MPFSKYAIDPEHVEKMRAAFYKVCEALMLKCDMDDPMTEVIVSKIFALGKTGDHDVDGLAELVLNDIAGDGQAAAE